MSGHASKVLSVDLAPNGAYIASGGFDRTVKLYGPEEGAASL